MTKQIDLLASKFVGYTEPRLVNRVIILSDIITDSDALDEEIATAAMERKEIRELLAVFDLVKDAGLDPSGMTAFEVIDIIIKSKNENSSAEQLAKPNAGGMLAQGLIERTSKLTKTAKDTTKKASAGLGAWLYGWGNNKQ